MTCLYCRHWVGEHLLCRDHGGEDIWSAAAYRQPERKLDAPLPPINVHDPWFAFLDRGQKILSEVTP